MRTLKEIYGGLSEEEFSLKCLDFEFFARNVLGYDIQPCHLEWIDLVLRSGAKRIAIQSFTGSGKTTILGNAYCLWLSWISEGKQMCIVSKTLQQSTKVLSEIKYAIEENELLQELIPKNKPRSHWCSSSIIDTSTHCKILCKPYSENIKGIHVDYVLGDEVSSFEDYDIWHRFVVTRTNTKDGVAVAISTPDNMSDLMQELIHNSEYIGRSYPAIKDDGTSQWPSRWPISKLHRIRDEIGVSKFELEYQCNVEGEIENAVYPPNIIHNCLNNELSFKYSPSDDNQFIIIACDFAISSGKRADFDSYVVLEKDKDGISRIIYGETHKGFPIESKKMRIRELYETYRKKFTGDKKSDENDMGIDDFGNIKVVIDPSGVGRAISDFLRAECIPFEEASFESSKRMAMLVDLREALENRELIIPMNNDEPMTQKFTKKLVSEMLSMVEVKQTNGLVYKTKAAHDDVVISTAMGMHYMKKQIPFLAYIGA